MRYIFIVCVIVLMAGCSVYMTPEYQAKVQQATNTIDDMVTVCATSDVNDCCAGLAEASRTLHLILDASYGRSP